MNNTRILFVGAMATVLVVAGADAAQIASKEYVDAREASIINAIDDTLNDYSTTTEINNMISTVVGGDVAGKADKVTGATNGNLAGLDGTGNLTDSGVSAADVETMQTNVNNLQTSVTNLGNVINNKADATDLAGKADLQGAGAADQVATVDANGQYIRSGTSMGDLATTTNVNTIVNNAITDAVSQITGDISDMETRTHAAATYETKTNVATGLAGKADLQGAGAAGVVATVDADGQYIRSGVAAANLATIQDIQDAVSGIDTSAFETKVNAAATYETKTNAEATYETKTNVAAGLALKEDVANKSNNITTDTGSATKYTTVNAVETYALPRPPVACNAPSTLCVLTVSNTGNPYWEHVVLAE